MEEEYTIFIGMSHSLANELLNKPDNFITATVGEKEYVIENIKIITSHANIDDSTTYLTLNLCDCGNGNIKR